MAECIRLDKFLAEMSLGSRSQIKEAAKKGRIIVNGMVEKKTDIKIDPDKDAVLWDGEPVTYVKFEYYMLNKPQGVVSATEDSLHKTVIDLLDDKHCRNDLFPVGRLDIDTEGLLLITNDGDLAHQLLSPKKHVNKEYYAKIAGSLPATAVEQFQNGMILKDGTPTLPADLIITRQVDGESDVILKIREGKFHQVKRMFEVLDCKVIYLKRLSMGSLRLDENLSLGEYRPLYEEELKLLKEKNHVKR